MTITKKALPVLILMLMLTASGCGRAKSPIAMKIGDISVMQSEFEEAFAMSDSGKTPAPEARRAFLDTYINSLLVLREAERQGLDKKEEFLKDVQAFWRQTLIKQMLTRKARAIAMTTNVSDSEISDYYAANPGMFKDKPLETVHGEIRWIILNLKHRTEVSAWVKHLRDTNKIDIDYNLLKISK